MLGKAIFDLFTNDAGISALVGTRVFPTVMQQGVDMPAICYTIITSSRYEALTQDTDLVDNLVQIDCYSETYPEVRSVYQAVRAALQRYQGTNAAIEIVDAVIDDERDIREEETKLFRTSVDYLITFRE